MFGGHAGRIAPTITDQMIRTIDEALRGRIAATGLIDQRKTCQLGDFISDYIESRVDAAESTKAKWRITAGHLEEHLGKEKPMHSITPGDADEFRLFLIGNELAENTVRGFFGDPKAWVVTLTRHTSVESFASRGSSNFGRPIANRQQQYLGRIFSGPH